jgi:hypothetical protein
MTTSNDYYGELNRRFDERAEVLRAMGFAYEYVPGYDIAVFVRRTLARKLPCTIPAGKVMAADDRMFADELERAARY